MPSQQMSSMQEGIEVIDAEPADVKYADVK